MVFSDLFFLFVFIPSFALSYFVASFLDRRRSALEVERRCLWRNLVSVVFSLIFYGWGEPIYLFLMVLCVAINYMSGLAIDRYDGAKRKRALVVGLVCNILILGIFKYAGFVASSLNFIGIPIPVPQIALPIGISFYTFQSISYLVDVYRRESPAQKRFGDLLLYISMFPQLVAGPIVRYDTIAREINDRSVSTQDISEGVFRFLIGLGKKVIIANQFSEVADQFLLNGVNNLSTAGAWIGTVAYAIQIYFDFSGYSDMAIGMGRCMGFHFNENFRHPYTGTSLTDFWRKWHISLGSFFRDYVYIPMGGNRRHQSLNILVVWLLTGLWHGASWNFVLWGLYFGVIVMVEKYTILRVADRIPRLFQHLYCLLLVLLSWGLFYYDDIGAMGKFYSSLFGNAPVAADIAEQTALMGNFWLWIVAILFCMPIRQYVSELFERLCAKHKNLLSWIQLSAQLLVSIAILILSVALLVGATNNAFIYTRF